jgi:hypothetical protein
MDPKDQTAVSRNLQKSRGETRGDRSIRDCILDVRVTDTDAKSNLSKDPAKVLEAHEKEKKKKYLEACLEQRRTFTPFVVSTDGLLGKEAKTLLKKPSTLLAEKWWKSYSEVCGYVNALMSIAIVRARHLCLRGFRVTSSHMSYRRPNGKTRQGSAFSDTRLHDFGSRSDPPRALTLQLCFSNPSYSRVPPSSPPGEKESQH